MSRINAFLLRNSLTIAENPCVSPDFCLDWPALQAELTAGAAIREHAHSAFDTRVGRFLLVENERGEHAWLLTAKAGAADALQALASGVKLGDGRFAFPASWQNLLSLKNLALEHDPACTIFPTATGSLEQK